MKNTQILFKAAIPRAGVFIFVVKITKLGGKNMVIGILNK